MSEPLDPLPDDDAHLPVPGFRTWRRAYAFVVICFVVQVVVYTALTWIYA
ncbi:MAG: hypothetical protein ACOC3I_01905 [Verrucomicrobiota bacterium]